MNNQEKQHLDICWKVFVEETLSRFIKKLNFGRKIIVTAPDELYIKSRIADWCKKNDIVLVYVDCRTITLKEANAIRHQDSFKDKLYVIDHISEIPDSPDQMSIYNMIVSSWKNNESANLILVKNSDESIEIKEYMNSLRYCSYGYYGPIVFDPTVEPSGEQQYVMKAKIEKYKELSLLS